MLIPGLQPPQFPIWHSRTYLFVRGISRYHLLYSTVISYYHLYFKCENMLHFDQSQARKKLLKFYFGLLNNDSSWDLESRDKNLNSLILILNSNGS